MDDETTIFLPNTEAELHWDRIEAVVREALAAGGAASADDPNAEVCPSCGHRRLVARAAGLWCTYEHRTVLPGDRVYVTVSRPGAQERRRAQWRASYRRRRERILALQRERRRRERRGRRRRREPDV